MDDFERRFKTSIGRHVQEVSAEPLRERTHRRVKRRRAFLAMGLTSIVAVVVAGGIGVAMQVTRGPDPLPVTEASPATPIPSDEQGATLEWPAPFVPDVQTEHGRTTLNILFPNRTGASISYPTELGLAENGVQPTVSYWLRDARRSGPHDIIFIRGEAPTGLLDPEPLQTFVDAVPEPLALHEVIYERLRGEPPFALVYEKSGWTIVATLQKREDAEVVAKNFHPSVTHDGWPTVFATGPVELAEGFGEARGAHVEIGDHDPLFDVVDAGDDFTYIIMGPVGGCKEADTGVSKLGDEWYGARCLEFEGGELGVFISIYGPERFVRRVHRGIELGI